MSNNANKSGSASPVVRLAVVGIVLMGAYYAWSGAATLTQRIAELPVEGLSEMVPDTEAVATGEGARQALHPLLVESSRKTRESRAAPAPVTAESLRRLDDVFGREAAVLEALARAEAVEREALERERQAREAAEQAARDATTDATAEAEETAPQPVWLVDHFARLAETVSIGALSTQGAVLAGQYHVAGEPVESLAYPALPDGTVRVPVLENVSRSGVVLLEPHTGRRVILRLE